MENKIKTNLGRQIVILTVFVMLVFVTLGPTYTRVSENLATLNVISLDEWAYLDFMYSSVYPKLKGLTLSFLFIRDNWGYGSLYYQIYALLSFPSYLIGNQQLLIITLRSISLAFLALSIYIIFLTLRLKNSMVVSLFGGVFLLFLPAFHFFQKPFSVEFFYVFVIGLFFYYYLKDNFKFGKEFFLAIFLTGLAIGLKLSAAPLLFSLAGYYLVNIGRYGMRKLPGLFLRAIPVLLLGFYFANPYLVYKDGLQHYQTLLKQNLKSNETAHGQFVSNENFNAWLTQVVEPEYLPPILLALLLAILLSGSIVELKRNEQFPLVFLSLLGFIVPFLYVTLNVKTLYYWYLYPAFILLPIGLFSLPFPKRVSMAAVLLALLVIVGVKNGPAIFRKHKAWNEAEKTTAFIRNKESGKLIYHYIDITKPKPRSILKTAYLYFETDRLTGIAVHTEWGFLSEKMLAEYTPDLILYQKDYGVLFPAEKVLGWTTYDEYLHGRRLFNAIQTGGVNVGGTLFKYQLVYETQDALVLMRQK